MIRHACMIVVAAGFVAGCSKAPNAPTKHTPERQVSSVATSRSGDTPFEALIRARDRARATQATVDKQAARQRKAIDAQTH